MTRPDDDSDIDDLSLALALRRLDEVSVVPPPEPAREAALMAAFDAHRLAPLAPGRRRVETRRWDYWGMAGLAAAAAVLIAIGIEPNPRSPATSPATSERSESKGPALSERSESKGQSPGEFVMVPGAAALPEIESGSLVRIDLPVSALPALGIMPPSGAVARVKADLIFGQDGLPRAVRLVN